MTYTVSITVNGDATAATFRLLGLRREHSRSLYDYPNSIRAFSVNEMRGPVEEDDPPGSYEMPGGFDPAEYLAFSWRLGPDPEPAKVRFEPELAAYIGSMLTHVPLEPQPDGAVEAVLVVGDIEDFVGWVLTFGSHARILEPPAAVERARVVLTEAVARHA